MNAPAPLGSPVKPGRLRLLPEATINRIAAGEVIERPAAAVRELVENALDAGAARISVAIDGGGIARIEVEDDGIGMTADELALCIQRHATSKLSDDTLVRIETLGFRGEALPSIGAAARLAITSRTRGADSAHTIAVEGGVVGAVAPSAGTPGTRVVVADLFFATPARRKFLKSPRAEADAAEIAVRRLAIAAPHVAFRLESDGRALFDLPAQPLAARVAALLGPPLPNQDAAGTLIPIDGSREDTEGGTLHLSGFIAPPSVTRATMAAQALVVNGRPVADPVLRTAVRLAYRDVIAYGRHPVVALFLTLPPESLDVNVHPAKAEVRFRAPDAVRGLVIATLSRALAAGAASIAPPPVLLPAGLQPHSGQPRTPGLSPMGFSEPRLALGTAPAARFFPPPAAPADAYDPETGQIAPRPDHPLGAPLAQVLDTYILAAAPDGALILVDQHAAHERLTHEALREQFLAGEIRRQPLLLPAVVDMPPADAARLLDQAETLDRLGLEIEAFGPGAILVRALPAALGTPDPAPLLRDLADEFAEHGEASALSARLDAAIARLACHGSIRAGRRLAAAEMDALLRRMEATPRAATCSHGRPTFLKLTRADIERLFGRR